MPTTRRTTGGTRARPGPGKGQSTISFAGRVTKTNAPKDVKKGLISDSTSPAAASIKKEEEEEEEELVKEVKLEEQEEDVEEDLKEEEDEEEEEATEEKVPVETKPEKSDYEAKAEKITDAQITKYWRQIEKERIAPRVHQEDLAVGEKVLRYFDVSSQYGPCIGITRMKRWQRAERLGFNPPIEVLAVLLKDQDQSQKAHMDEIMNSTAVGAM